MQVSGIHLQFLSSCRDQVCDVYNFINLQAKHHTENWAAKQIQFSIFSFVKQAKSVDLSARYC